MRGTRKTKAPQRAVPKISEQLEVAEFPENQTMQFVQKTSKMDLGLRLNELMTFSLSWNAETNHSAQVALAENQNLICSGRPLLKAGEEAAWRSQSQQEMDNMGQYGQWIFSATDGQSGEGMKSDKPKGRCISLGLWDVSYWKTCNPQEAQSQTTNPATLTFLSSIRRHCLSLVTLLFWCSGN